MPRVSVVRLVEEGRLGAAVEFLEADPKIDLSEQVLKAFLEGLIGSQERAAQAATGLLNRHLNRVQKAQLLETTARTANRLDALRLLNRAQELFSASNDAVEAARFGVRYGRATLNLVGVEAAHVELPRIRKAALNAADISAVIDLHLLTAETESKRNKPSRCRAHLRMAEDLLASTSNVLQRARLEQVRSNLAALSSNLQEALAAAHECAKFAMEAGWSAGLTGALGNIGLFKLALGDLDGAAESLRSASQLVHNSRIVALAARDTKLQLLIARADSTYRDFAEELWNNDFSGEWRFSYYGLWHHLTRARMLLNDGRELEALHLAEGALDYILNNSERQFELRFRLLAAEANVACGRVGAAVEHVRTVYAACDELPLETITDLERVIGLIQEKNASDVAGRFVRRADTLLARAGLETARKQLNTSQASSIASGVANEFRTPAEYVHSLSALLYFSFPAEQRGVELVNLIGSLRATTAAGSWRLDGQGRVVVLASFGNPPISAETVPWVTITGSTGFEVFLCVGEPSGPSEAAVLAALKHLAESSNELQDARTRVREAAPLWPEETPEEQLGMVVASANMLEVVNTARRLAPSTIPVLITGETGTGKELLARALHDASPRKDKPFIPFNCTAVARDMLDAQLFGYRRGAFTGAQDAFPGVIRAAAGGTLFLDEIGEITLDVQPKLLRFLESNEIHPLGEPKPIHVDVRVVAATNANLEQMVTDGRFREDLFYRLNVVRLPVPSLRERREEIPLLVQHYLQKYRREALKAGLSVAEDTMEYLVLYRWPGNVRQLANELRRLVALAEAGAVLMPEHLSREIAASRRTMPASERDLAPTEFIVRTDQPLVAAVEHVERTLILQALRQTNNRVEEAAQLLGLSRKGLYLKRQRLGIDQLDSRAPKNQPAVSADA